MISRNVRCIFTLFEYMHVIKGMQAVVYKCKLIETEWRRYASMNFNSIGSDLLKQVPVKFESNNADTQKTN